MEFESFTQGEAKSKGNSERYDEREWSRWHDSPPIGRHAKASRMQSGGDLELTALRLRPKLFPPIKFESSPQDPVRRKNLEGGQAPLHWSTHKPNLTTD